MHHFDMAGAQLREYRFIGINTPNLARIEANASNSMDVALPSEEEIWDLLCAVQQIGARVARTYVLSFCDDGACHIRSGAPTPQCECWRSFPLCNIRDSALCPAMDLPSLSMPPPNDLHRSISTRTGSSHWTRSSQLRAIWA